MKNPKFSLSVFVLIFLGLTSAMAIAEKLAPEASMDTESMWNPM